MTELKDYIAEIVAKAPPLTPEQRDRIAILLHGEGAVAPTWGRSRPPAAPKPTKIYRHYDICGCLLYIGISHDPIKRAYAHGGTSWWTRWAIRMDTDEAIYADRQEALTAERDLIQGEAPVFNTVHATGKRASIIRYLIAHERWDHLSVAANVSADQKPDLLTTLAEVGLLDGVSYYEEPIE